MLEGNEFSLLLGIAIGILLTVKPVREVVAELPKAVYPYTIFGFLLFGASLFGATAAHDVAGGWLGFTCVVVVFLLYHLVGSEGLPTPLRSFFLASSGFHGPRKKSHHRQLTKWIRLQLEPRRDHNDCVIPFWRSARYG